MKKAFDYIDSHQLNKAAKIGRKLLDINFSGGFEILALLELENRKTKKAIKILEEGVKKAPNVWILWQLLGNSYSDEKEPEKAQNAYSMALKCPDNDSSSIYLNIAIALSREGKHEQSLEACKNIKSKKMFLKRIALEMSQLNQLGRYDKCILNGEKQIGKIQDGLGTEEEFNLSNIYSYLASAYWSKCKNTVKSSEFVFKAIELNKTNSDAMWLLREIENNRSADSKYLRIVVEGKAIGMKIEDSDNIGFFTSYDVVAKDEDEALSYIKRFEPKDVRDTLRISKCKVREKKTRDPKGVYYCNSGYTYFSFES